MHHLEGIHYVYLLYNIEKYVCKIGYSFNPELRRRAISNQCNMDFELKSQIRFSNGWAAMDYELNWVRHLKPHVIYGREYFFITKKKFRKVIRDFNNLVWHEN